MSGRYTDIHTHHIAQNLAGIVSVRNILIQDSGDLAESQGFYSVGLHPWDSGTVEFNPGIMNALLARPDVIAVGECGIDRLRGAGLGTQSGLFRQQALLAGEHGKPVIIHCVRCWSELSAIKTEIRPKVPWIIHGFSGKPALARQLSEAGFHLSFGERILIRSSQAAESLRVSPDDRVFLETDAGRESIERIYEAAASIKNISLAALQDRIDDNFERVFGIHGTSRMASAD
jgi:TatD DNase family protein